MCFLPWIVFPVADTRAKVSLKAAERFVLSWIENKHLLHGRAKFNLASSWSDFYSFSYSFARTILCRSQCDNCKRVIRFLGVRCQDCRFVQPWGFNQYCLAVKIHCTWIVMCIYNTTDLTIWLCARDKKIWMLTKTLKYLFNPKVEIS